MRTGEGDGGIETIDSRPQEKPGIALDAGGTVHLAYTLAAGVRQATRAGAAWLIETVNPAGVGPPAAIAIERGGAIHLAYAATDGLRHATNRDGPWSIETVDPHGVNPSMAVDATGTVHLSYGNGVEHEGFVRYATGTAGAWRIETPTDTRAWTGSIALGRRTARRIAVGSIYIADPDVHVLARVAGGWSDDRILTDNALYSVMLRLDGQDQAARPLHPSGRHLLCDPLAGRLAHRTDRRPRQLLWREPVARSRRGRDQPRRGDDLPLPRRHQRRVQQQPGLAPDGVDQNCDGVDGVDADGDGHASMWTGGDDCDDDDPSSPFAADGDAAGCPPPP